MARTERHRVGERAARVVCPLCPEVFAGRVREFDRHVLAHGPTREQARRWLSAKAFDWAAVERGWLAPCPGSGTVVDRIAPATLPPEAHRSFRECPTCGRLCRYRRGMRIASHPPASTASTCGIESRP